ncbi:MAG: diguanylate cyclase [Planctomycetes bacterium]|nr:diguanylate cyclase [Planctomycetota bacterium]
MNETYSVPPALQQLQQDFASARTQRVAELRRLYSEAGSDARALDQLRVAFHKLAGSAGLLGFPKSGTIARESERLLSNVTTIPAELPALLDKLTESFENEAVALGRPASPIQPATTAPPLPSTPIPSPDREMRRGIGCIVANRESSMVNALKQELTATGFEARFVAPELAPTQCSGAALALIDVNAAGDGYSLCRTIADAPAAPCLRILFTEGNSQFNLLKMSPSRAHRMIHRAFELKSVLRPDTMDDGFLKSRILSVEDDADYMRAIEEILKPVGHTVRVISRPERLLEELSDFRPEVLLLDWDLPQVNGHDLARIIRSDARHELLPIVFCTGRTERRDRRAAIRAGADDFLTKPFAPDELVETIDTQLRRHRALRRRLDADPLTELLNRSASLIAVDDLIQSTKDQDRGVLVAILDIDHFKQVNDELGHPAGDRVLRELSAHLRACTSPGDVAGRLGGEELLLGMVFDKKEDALAHLDNIRTTLHIELRSEDGGFLRQLTFSAGAAWFPEHGTQSGDLLKKADQALYRAKNEGRNRIVAVTEK